MRAVPITPTIMAKLTHAKGEPLNFILQAVCKATGARSVALQSKTAPGMTRARSSGGMGKKIQSIVRRHGAAAQSPVGQPTSKQGCHALP
jgi:hypothetical protein